MPHDVTADAALLRRFQHKVAYRDRPWPSLDDYHCDADVLQSTDAVLVVAWLWPDARYEPGFDPFDSDPRPAPDTAAAADDQERRRQAIAERAREIIAVTAMLATPHDPESVRAHLAWETRLTGQDLKLMLDGQVAFPFPVIVALCRALQLAFTGAWTAVDPRRLALRIEHSVIASEIAERLRSLTLDNLRSVQARLPQGPGGDDPVGGPEAYPAPEPGSRYSPLHAVLAADTRESPVYTWAEIDRLLPARLPQSARKRSWWAGSGAASTIEGRPQVNAWLGAGYRVRTTTRTPGSDDVVSIEFESLPGRAEWLESPARASHEYRVPPDRVKVYPDATEGLRAALLEFARAMEPVLRRHLPDDPDIATLTEFLHRVGEADRAEIERELMGIHDDLDATWLTNLLTRARRQGWIANKGTRKRPRWASIRTRERLIDTIAEKVNLEPPALDPAGPVPVEFLRQVADRRRIAVSGESARQVAREIIEARGGVWRPEFESADSSVTSSGLEAVDEAIGPGVDWRPEWDEL